MRKFVLLFLLVGCTPPEESVRNAVRQHLKIPQAPDEVLDVLELQPSSALVRVNTAGEVRTFPIFYLTHQGSGWKVEFELRERFKKLLEDAAFEKEFLERLAKRMAERFNRAVNIKPGIPKIPTFDEADKTVLARIGTLFNASPEPGRMMDFYYSETYRFKDGQWAYDSYNLLDRVPQK